MQKVCTERWIFLNQTDRLTLLFNRSGHKKNRHSASIRPRPLPYKSLTVHNKIKFPLQHLPETFLFLRSGVFFWCSLSCLDSENNADEIF